MIVKNIWLRLISKVFFWLVTILNLYHMMKAYVGNNMYHQVIVFAFFYLLLTSLFVRFRDLNRSLYCIKYQIQKHGTDILRYRTFAGLIEPAQTNIRYFISVYKNMPYISSLEQKAIFSHSWKVECVQALRKWCINTHFIQVRKELVDFSHSVLRFERSLYAKQLDN